MHTDQLHPPSGPTLVCPNCGYNLTGLPEDRCPECGEPFDPEELRRIASDDAQLLPGTTGAPLTDAVRIATQVFLRPREFARRFPGNYRPGQVFRFSCCCYSASLALPALVSIFLIDGLMLLALPLVTLGAITGFTLCEVLIAATAAALLKLGGNRNAYRFWRGLVRCAGGFTLLAGLWSVLSLVIVTANLSSALTRVSLLAAAAPVLSWWAIALSRMICQRAAGQPGLWVCQLLIPVIGLVSIGIGTLVGSLGGLAWPTFF